MTSLRLRRGPLVRPAPPRPGHPVVGRVLFAVVLGIYLTIGAVLVFGFDSIMEDALSRVAAASSVWWALDPKLAAVGFVWTPLPALIMVVFTPLRAVWPQLVSSGWLAVILSATAMAAAVTTMHAILADLRVRPSARWTLTVLFALQPLILVYSANGMTEALLMLFLLLAARRMLRWMSASTRADATQLVSAGLFLGLGYLARYEAIVAAAAVTVLVMAATYLRTPRCEPRWPAVLVDGLLVALPTGAAFLLWAIISWAVVGSPFEQFTSVYGNSALVAGGGGRSGGLADVGRQLLWLMPLAVPVLIAAVMRALRSREAGALVPLALFGSVLAFEWLLNLTGTLFGFLRYQIMVVPLVAILLGILLCRTRPVGGWRTTGALGLIGLVLGSSLVTSGLLLFTEPVLAGQEYLRVRPVVEASLGEPVTDTGANGMWTDDRAIAARLDELDLPPGSVLADTGSAFALVAASRNPHQFLITSDDGFAAALADPPAHGIRYLLRNEHGGVDTVRTTWPDLGTTTGPAWARKIALYRGAGPWSYAWTLWATETGS